MECREIVELLPEYTAGELDPESLARFERHTNACAACRKAAEQQQALWNSLGAWDLPPISPDFDQKLAVRMGSQRTWRERFLTAISPALVRRALPIAAAAGLAVTAAVFLDHSARRTPQQPGAQLETVRADQQESVLEDMEMLREFNGLAHPDTADSSM